MTLTLRQGLWSGTVMVEHHIETERIITLMVYTIKQLAELAGVSVRTLHYYDEIGLLRPSRAQPNGYRQYDEPELLRLQQILFFRELDFPLEEIQKILQAPDFNMKAALKDQRKLIELKKKRLVGLIATIDKTLKKLNNEITMSDQDLYGDFSDEQMKQYAEEAKQRWGNTEAYKQSMERTKHFTKDDYKRMKEDGIKFNLAMVALMPLGPKHEKVQAMIAEHYNALRTFYEPNLELYEGLARMYVDDPRFAAYYNKHASGLAVFMRDAMLYYVEQKRKQ